MENNKIKGQFLKRYKRFFADIKLDNNEVVTAHVPNTGSMKGLLTEKAPALLTYNDDPKRKLKYTLEALKTPTSWVGVNTSKPNKMAALAFEKQLIPHWEPYSFIKTEAKINDKTRIDLALAKNLEIKKWDKSLIDEHKFHFVEIKNVTLSDKNTALFPDAVTERGLKHLNELIDLVKSGHSAELLFIVQRQDCDHFLPAYDIHPEYATTLQLAQEQGVRLTALECQWVEGLGFELNSYKPLDIKFQ